MATNYPNSLDNFTNPTSASPINSPSHSEQHANANDAIEALESKVGSNNSVVTTSHDYKIAQLESLVTSAVSGAKSIYQDVRNQSGSAFIKATPVYVSGSVGSSGKILISAASNASEATSSKTMGITTSAISNNSNGQVISEGILEGIDTTGAADGDPIWLGVDGVKIYGLANKPSAPAHLVFLGIVIRGGQANTGSMYVKIQNGFELEELHNVQISSLLNGNIIAYDSSTSTWKNTNTLQSTSSTIPLVIKGATSQTADLQQWQNSAGTVLTSISSAGNLNIGSTSYDSAYAAKAQISSTFYAMSSNAPIGGLYLLSSDAVAADVGGMVSFGGLYSGSSQTRWAAIGGLKENATSGQYGGYLSLGTRTNGAGGVTERMRINSAGNVLVNGFTASTVGLTVKGASSQIANLQEWHNNAGTVLAKVNATGQFIAVGDNLNNFQSIGASSTAYNGFTVSTNTNGANYVMGTAGASETSFGVANSFYIYDGIAGVMRLRINSSGLVGINTVATSQLHVNNSTSANVGLIVKGAASQTANLQEWQDSTGAVLVSVQANGYIQGTYINVTSGGGILSSSSNQLYANSGSWLIVVPGPTKNGLIIQAAASQTSDLQQWRNSANTVIASVNSGGYINSSGGIKASSHGYIYTSSTQGSVSFQIGDGNASYVPLVIKGVASQTANLQEWQNSGGTVLASISSTGKLTSAVDASINGMTIGLGGGNLSSNIALGGSALLSNTTGASNTSIGGAALYANTTGSSNIAIGLEALNNNIVGNYNTAIGVQSLKSSNTSTANYNVAIGLQSMFYNTSGGANTAIGPVSLLSNTSGNANIAIGYSALYSNTSGYNNTAIGSQAGNSNVTGIQNVFIGYNAGYNETGSNKLYIANSNTATPLIGGDFSAKTLTVAGNATIISQDASSSVLLVKAAASQAGSIIQWQNSSGTTIGEINNQGIFRNTYNYVQNLQGLGGGSGLYLNDVTTTAFNTNPTHLVFKVQGFASQTANLTEWQNSSGTVLASVDAYGTLLSNWKAYIQSGASYLVPITIRAAASQTANLQEWQNSAGTVLANIKSDGVIAIGGTPGTNVKAYIEESYTGNSGANTGLRVRGTGSSSSNWKGRIIAGGDTVAFLMGEYNSQAWLGGHNAALNAWAPFYINPDGTQNLYLGNTGVGGSTPIVTIKNSDGFVGIGTGLPSAKLHIVNTSASAQGVIVKGAASQTADLIQWQNSDGVVLSSISPSGNFSAKGLSVSSVTNTTNAGTFYNAAGTIVFNVDTSLNQVNIGGGLSGGANNFGSSWGYDSSANAGFITFQTGALGGDSLAMRRTNHVASGDYTISTLGNMRLSTAIGKNFNFNNGNIGVATTAIGTNNKLIVNPYSTVDNLATVQINTNAVTNKGLVVQGIASQTANLQEWQNSTGTVLNAINSSGSFIGGQFDINGNLSNILYIDAIRNLAAGNPYGSSETDEPKLSLFGKTGQTSNFIEIKSIGGGSGNLLLSITPDGSIKGGNSSTISANTATTVDTVAISSFTTIEYTISIKQGSKVRSSKVLVHTDGTSIDSTEYGIMEMGGAITGILVTASVSSTNSILQVTITDAATTNATVKLIKTML
jgi:hypothetical protein